MLENINFRKTQLNQRYLQFKSDDNNDRNEYDALSEKLNALEEKRFRNSFRIRKSGSRIRRKPEQKQDKPGTDS